MERVGILKAGGNTSRHQDSIEKWVDSIVPEGDPDNITSCDGVMICNEDDLSLGAEAKMMIKDAIPNQLEEKATRSPAVDGISTSPQAMDIDMKKESVQVNNNHVTSNIQDEVNEKFGNAETQKVTADINGMAAGNMESSCERELSWRTKLALMGLIHMDSIQSQPDLTSKVYTSVDEILQDRETDPEEILTNLGFAGQNQMDSPALRVPTRFLKTPSKASGIRVETFLENNPELHDYLAAKGIVLEENCQKGNPSNNISLVQTHVDKYTNLAQIGAYCMASEVPNHFLFSLAKMFPTMPLFAVATGMMPDTRQTQHTEMSVNEWPTKSCDQFVNSCDQITELHHQTNKEQVKINQDVLFDEEKSLAQTVSNNKACAMEPATVTSSFGLRNGDTVALQNAHILAACQAEIAVMESRTRSVQSQTKDSSSLLVSPNLDCLLDHITNDHGDAAPKYITVATDSLPGSDDQFCQFEFGEEQWDYSDVDGFQREMKPKKSLSMPKLELYHTDEFYSASEEFPRSETIDFFIYDTDKSQLSLLDDTAANTNYHHHGRLQRTETLL